MDFLGEIMEKGESGKVMGLIKEAEDGFDRAYFGNRKG